MAALGAVGVSARTGVGGSTSHVAGSLGGLTGGVPRGVTGRNGGPSDPTAITAIALVQSRSAVTATSQATLSAVFPVAPTQDNTLGAIASSDATVTMTSTGWTPIPSSPVINFTGHYFWVKDAGASESSTVTITPGATTTAELFIFELSGTTAAALDVSASNNPGSNAATIASGTTGATAQADEVTFASFSWNDSTGFGATFASVSNTSGPVAPKPAKLADLRGTDPTNMDTMLGVAYRFTPAAGAQSATATLSNTGGRPTGIIATFKAVGVGTSHALAGQSDSFSTSTGDLSVTRGLAGTSASTSTSTGDLAVSHTLEGASASTSLSAGALLVAVALEGTSTSTSTSGGTLNASYALQGASAGTSTSAGALVVQWALAGISASTSASIGTLVATGPVVPVAVLEGDGWATFPETGSSVSSAESSGGVLALIE